MIKHPHSRAERLRLKYLKDNFEPKSKRSAVKRIRSEIEEKELEDELRKQVLGSEEEAVVSAHPV